MATGILGVPSNLLATTNTSVYTVPAATFAVVTVSICNRGATAVTIRLAVAALSTPTDAEYLEYGVSLGANSVLERTGIVMQTGKILVVYSSAATVTAIASGIETSTA